MNKILSISIASYNVEKFINQALDSYIKCKCMFLILLENRLPFFCRHGQYRGDVDRSGWTGHAFRECAR